jgi:hypothetical protein
MSRDDMESMMNYVSSGNTVFISAQYVDRKLIDTLGAKISFDFASFFGFDEYGQEKKDTWISLAHSSGSNDRKYGFYFVPFDNKIVSNDSVTTQVLGYNEKLDTNFIAIDHGQGKFILHTAPAAFSNYFLLTGSNKEYLESAFSYLNAETSSVYWDNFYRLGQRPDNDNFSIAEFFKKISSIVFCIFISAGFAAYIHSFWWKKKAALRA